MWLAVIQGLGSFLVNAYIILLHHEHHCDSCSNTMSVNILYVGSTSDVGIIVRIDITAIIWHAQVHKYVLFGDSS